MAAASINGNQKFRTSTFDKLMLTQPTKKVTLSNSDVDNGKVGNVSKIETKDDKDDDDGSLNYVDDQSSFTSSTNYIDMQSLSFDTSVNEDGNIRKRNDKKPSLSFKWVKNIFTDNNSISKRRKSSSSLSSAATGGGGNMIPSSIIRDGDEIFQKKAEFSPSSNKQENEEKDSIIIMMDPKKKHSVKLDRIASVFSNQLLTPASDLTSVNSNAPIIAGDKLFPVAPRPKSIPNKESASKTTSLKVLSGSEPSLPEKEPILLTKAYPTQSQAISLNLPLEIQEDRSSFLFIDDKLIELTTANSERSSRLRKKEGSKQQTAKRLSKQQIKAPPRTSLLQKSRSLPNPAAPTNTTTALSDISPSLLIQETKPANRRVSILKQTSKYDATLPSQSTTKPKRVVTFQDFQDELEEETPRSQRESSSDASLTSTDTIVMVPKSNNNNNNNDSKLESPMVVKPTELEQQLILNQKLKQTLMESSENFDEFSRKATLKINKLQKEKAILQNACNDLRLEIKLLKMNKSP